MRFLSQISLPGRSAITAILLAFVMLVFLAGCQDDDIGVDCKGMDIPVESGATSEGDVMRAQGSEIVEYNAEFPCQTTVCIATLGRGGYCTQECTRDEQCPQAFSCRQVMDIGPFADSKYCSWKECENDDECGDPYEYACAKVEELSLGEVVKLCGWR
ncbi:MAG: hypothetical protein A2341_18375 [Deltaproteobacteria bacterium RIFOXYB12_FULL_58_9]|nr:MAG: hypothetical protein A2341_18375 [Deltaproteobacteria bacterium RIFOXYB12_FULL_58_9]